MNEAELELEKNMNLVQLLIENKIADNCFRAAHIVNGLKLWECTDETKALEMAMLYREWRNAGEPSKIAYANAKAWKPKPTNLFEITETGEKNEPNE